MLTHGSWEFFNSAAPTAQNSPELHSRFTNSFIQKSLVGSQFDGVHSIKNAMKNHDFILISVKDMEDMTLDELDELEDEEEERILEQYRKERMAQIKNVQARNNSGGRSGIEGFKFC